MVDKDARVRAAALLREFAAGRITNDQFEDRWPQTHDPAIEEIRSTAWHLYDDLREHHLTGNHALSNNLQNVIARWVLFLESDHAYEWPRQSALHNVVLTLANLLTLGWVGRMERRRFIESGEAAIWPFKSAADYKSAQR